MLDDPADQAPARGAAHPNPAARTSRAPGGLRHRHEASSRWHHPRAARSECSGRDCPGQLANGCCRTTRPPFAGHPGQQMPTNVRRLGRGKPIAVPSVGQKPGESAVLRATKPCPQTPWQPVGSASIDLAPPLTMKRRLYIIPESIGQWKIAPDGTTGSAHTAAAISRAVVGLVTETLAGKLKKPTG